MESESAIKLAAQAWCKPNTSDIGMDDRLCHAFVAIIDSIWSQPWLGNATTGELLDELKARAEMNGTLNYRTVDKSS